MMSDTGGMMSAFQAASGVSPAQLSYDIRAILVVLCALWAVWVLLGSIRGYKHKEKPDILQEFGDALQVAFVLSLVIVLIFIG